ncbi:hypothetical protein ACJIZ3_007378 [Penstemon smallii]|uniref:DUF1421 domain-containing protein n=1 Tax=Penstemon smallii TaxID=265156 RepID=A0ABD3SAW2_9LAMI
MASGSSGRASNSGSKAFDFASDDILCSYEDENNGIHSDPSISANSAKEFHKSRMARSSVFPTAAYSPPEESSFNQDVITTVDKTVKKYTDNLLRFLEGISSRLSQLELYCYNLDKSIGEMRSDLVGDHEESDSKLKSLEKHIQEVHRSVQILRDKQELADTQKELAKLQLGKKESSSTTNNTQQNEERTSPYESQKSEDSSDAHGKQLALVLPHQVAPQPLPPAQPIEHQQPHMAPQSSIPSQSMSQVHAYYLPTSQMTNMPPPSQPSQIQYLPPQSQIQDPSRMAPQPTQTQVNQSPQVQYQLQWSHQPQQQQVMQPQMRPSSQVVYSSYMPTQANQSPAEMAPNSMPMQVSFAGSSHPGSAGPEVYGYGATGRPIQLQSAEGYAPSGPRAALPPGSAYMMFDPEGGRAHHSPPQHNFQQSAYPPNPQRMINANMVVPQSPRSHPYKELIEKLVSMGYRGDHVVGLIQRLEESGQPVDFNTVLDRLNGHPSGGPQRTWSG